MGLVTEQLKALAQPPATIYRIVLTGGPCAGKTTALAAVISALELRGIRVLTVPESATIMFTNGAGYRDITDTEEQVY